MVNANVSLCNFILSNNNKKPVKICPYVWDPDIINIYLKINNIIVLIIIIVMIILI